MLPVSSRLGIVTEMRVDSGGDYLVLAYSSNAIRLYDLDIFQIIKTITMDSSPKGAKLHLDENLTMACVWS